MPVKPLKSTDSITFALSADVHQKLEAWRAAQDAMVFQEQVRTGGFRGKQKLSADVWFLIKEMHKAGEIAPYYGASGGGYTYQFQCTSEVTIIRLTNGLTGEFLEVAEPSAVDPQTH